MTEGRFPVFFDDNCGFNGFINPLAIEIGAGSSINSAWVSRKDIVGVFDPEKERSGH